MNGRAFSWKEPMSVSTLLQEFKSAFDGCRIHEGPAMWLFNLLLTGPEELAAKWRVTLANSVEFHHADALKWYSAIVLFYL